MTWLPSWSSQTHLGTVASQWRDWHRQLGSGGEPLHSPARRSQMNPNSYPRWRVCWPRHWWSGGLPYFGSYIHTNALKSGKLILKINTPPLKIRKRTIHSGADNCSYCTGEEVQTKWILRIHLLYWGVGNKHWNQTHISPALDSSRVGHVPVSLAVMGTMR